MWRNYLQFHSTTLGSIPMCKEREECQPVSETILILVTCTVICAIHLADIELVLGSRPQVGWRCIEMKETLLTLKNSQASRQALPWTGVQWRCAQGAMSSARSSARQTRNQISEPKTVGSCATWCDWRLWFIVCFHVHIYYSVYIRFSYASPSLPFLPWAFQSLSEWNLSGTWGTREPPKSWAPFARSRVWATADQSWPQPLMLSAEILPDLLAQPQTPGSPSSLFFTSCGASWGRGGSSPFQCISQSKAIATASKPHLEGSFTVNTL